MTIAQSIVFPSQTCREQELYFHASGNTALTPEGILLESGTRFNTNTYMNLFDVRTWKNYTGITDWTISFFISGKGTLTLFCLMPNGGKNVCEKDFYLETIQELRLALPVDSSEGLYYFEITAETKIFVQNVSYVPSCAKAKPEPEIQLGLIICTYKRNKELYRNLKILKNTRFFRETDEWYGHLHIYIVDNASELPVPDEKNISLYHNPNTGGSGGFTRGIEEIRKTGPVNGITNVVFMDDDVEIIPETFYRLYALLLLLKQEYRKSVIAGRMFRTDRRWIQYTAAEIWNGGNILHIGWNADMTDRKNLLHMNENTGAEYGGWWFACFPIKFVQENTPLPFFLHCDDVEYGLRHGGEPLILNGIQVWHETYEYRQSPVLAYYDIRNSLIVNACYGLLPDRETVLADWKSKITEQHVKKDYLTERMLIKGLADFGSGVKNMKRKNPQKNHVQLHRKKKCLKLVNSLYWRITEKSIFVRYDKILQSYRDWKV